MPQCGVRILLFVVLATGLYVVRVWSHNALENHIGFIEHAGFGFLLRSYLATISLQNSNFHLLMCFIAPR